MSNVLQADGEIIDAHSVRFERVLPGPIERVWAYLTESEKRGKWLATGNFDLRVGGKAELNFRHANLTPHEEVVPDKYRHLGDCVSFVGRITRCAPPRLLSYTWGDKPADSEVTFELTPRGKDVLLVLTHRQLGKRAEMISVAAGWETHLGILIDHLNDRTPQPFWTTHAKLEADYEKKIGQ